jgi:hypothetical protein
LRPDPVALGAQSLRAGDVDGEWTIDPSTQAAIVHARQFVAARQHRDTCAGADRALEHDIGQAATRMARHHDITGGDCRGRDGAADERDAPGEPRPAADNSVVHLGARRRLYSIDGNCRRRRVVEQQHGQGQQSVPRSQVDHTAAAKQPARPPRYLPGFEQLLARQAAGAADAASKSIEERVRRKPGEVVLGQTLA